MTTFPPQPAGAPANAPVFSGLPRHAPNELVVQFAPGADRGVRAAAVSAVGGGELEIIRTSANEHAGHGVLARVAVGHGLDLDRAIEILSRRPGVEFAERNWEVSVEATSDDPAYTRGMLWGMY